jgi:hypothetical protein
MSYLTMAHLAKTCCRQVSHIYNNTFLLVIDSVLSAVTENVKLYSSSKHVHSSVSQYLRFYFTTKTTTGFIVFALIHLPSCPCPGILCAEAATLP